MKQFFVLYGLACMAAKVYAEGIERVRSAADCDDDEYFDQEACTCFPDSSCTPLRLCEDDVFYLEPINDCACLSLEEYNEFYAHDLGPNCDIEIQPSVPSVFEAEVEGVEGMKIVLGEDDLKQAGFAMPVISASAKEDGSGVILDINGTELELDFDIQNVKKKKKRAKKIG